MARISIAKIFFQQTRIGSLFSPRTLRWWTLAHFRKSWALHLTGHTPTWYLLLLMAMTRKPTQVLQDKLLEATKGRAMLREGSKVIRNGRAATTAREATKA